MVALVKQNRHEGWRFLYCREPVRVIAIPAITRTGSWETGVPRFIIRRENAQFYLVPCSGHNYGLIGLKPARCKESAARTGFVNPLSRRDAADGRFKANPSGRGQEAVGFGARRQRMHPYAILLVSRPQPLGPPSTHNYDWNRALESRWPSGVVRRAMLSLSLDHLIQFSRDLGLAGWWLIFLISIRSIGAGLRSVRRGCTAQGYAAGRWLLSRCRWRGWGCLAGAAG